MPIGEKPQMTSSRAGAARICGEQDCNERTNRPDHPLCYSHWLKSQDSSIDECPNHPGVYKPSEYSTCRSCCRQRQPPAQPPRTSDRQQPQDDSRGWNRQTTPEVEAVSSQVVKSVELVRRNLERRESVNHESNTIQFLIEPMLRGLGWDDGDPEQVIREYKPAGKQRFRQSMAVDIALLERGAPKVFIEAKRLDREHAPEYDEQLARYASHLDDGIAVLTNGRYWQVYAVANGNPVFQRTIDIAEGNAESVAKELYNVIGKDVISNSGETSAPSVPSQRLNRPETATQPPTSNDVKLELLRYRRKCYQEMMRRGQRAYYIVNDETIERVVAQRPTTLEQLRGTQGVSPSTLERHGDAILKIVRGEG